jgi:hypothetical protein
MGETPPWETGGDGGDGGGTSGGTSGGSSSSSSSSSSGGSSAPSVDPVIQQKISAFKSVYFELWGEPATEAYLTSAAQKGWSVAEFAANERGKPAWWTTKQAKDATFAWVERRASLGL